MYRQRDECQSQEYEQFHGEGETSVVYQRWRLALAAMASSGTARACADAAISPTAAAIIIVTAAYRADVAAITVEMGKADPSRVFILVPIDDDSRE